MLLFPEVQARAQQELDEVIGHDRLPSLNDRDKLPYLNALVLEVIRWHTVAPIGKYALCVTIANCSYVTSRDYTSFIRRRRFQQIRPT
jgi:cytochrome P450